MKTFCIITNPVKDKDQNVTNYIKNYLERSGKICYIAKTDPERPQKSAYLYTDPEQIPKDVDCILVLGGDGTLIQAVRDFRCRDIPLAGINIGTLGFLSMVDYEDVERGLKALVKGDYRIEERMLLKVSVIMGDEVIYEDVAFNDVVLSRTGFSRLVECRVYLNGKLLNIYTGDGVILSTPTGSTGYNLSAGGPIVTPETDMMIITPICPHTLSSRSIVVSGNDKVTMEVGRRRRTQKEEAVATIDGQSVFEMEAYDRVEIEKTNMTAKLIHIEGTDFFEVLRSKIINY